MAKDERAPVPGDPQSTVVSSSVASSPAKEAPVVEDIRKSFHHQLDEIHADVLHLGALVTEFIPRATTAFLKGDLREAQTVIDEDDVLDALTMQIEERCFQVLALQQPMAGDLRAIVTALKLASELERDG